MLKKVFACAAAATMSLMVSTAWADVSGDWTFAVEIPGVGGGNASVTMQEGEDGTLTGTYSGQLGNTDFTGTVEDGEFSFPLTTQMGTVTYSGEQQDDDTLTGILDLGGQGEGSFTATRQQ